MQVNYVDGNPVFDGIDWVITVDSTTDEDNVSTCGYDDGGGVYSGGGCGGPGGLPDGATSLREAIIVANKIAQSTTIKFNIPTSDPNWNTVDYPNAFMIKPASALTHINNNMIIDGFSQTLFTGDTSPAISEDQTLTYSGLATTGPEIIIDGSNTPTLINTSGSELTVKNIGLYNQKFGGGQRPIAITAAVTKLTVTGCDFVNDGNGGIGLYSANPVIISITGNVMRGVSADPTRDAIEGNLQTGVIDGNQIIGNNAAGIGVYHNPPGTTGTLTISDNLIKNNGLSAGEGQNGIIVGDAGNINLIVTGNTIIANQKDGITVLDGGRAEIQNNTIYANGDNDIDITNLPLQLVVPLTNSLGDGVTLNDSGDSDTGGNNLQNFPVILTVEYLGAGQYRLSGDIDGNAPETPWEIEICEADGHASGHGGCIDSLGFTTANSPWQVTVTVPGSNGHDNRIFSSLATNANGSTSEFSDNFIAADSNTNYTVLEYPVQLVYPIGGVQIDDLTPLLDWNASQINGFLNPEVAHYEVFLDGVYFATMDDVVTSLQILSPLALGEHNWQVVAYRVDGEETGRSTTETFTVIEPRNEFVPIYPVDVTIDEKTPLFDWEDLPGAQEYDLYMDGVLIKPALTGSEFRLPDELALSEGEHNWQVFAYIIEPDGTRTKVGETQLVNFRVNFPDAPVPGPVELPDTGQQNYQADPLTFVPLITAASLLVLTFVATNPNLVVIAVGLAQLIGVLIGVLIPRNKKYWGVIFDEQESKGIAFAVARLINTQTKEILETVSDLQGRYGFAATAGEYKLVALASGFHYYERNISIQSAKDVIEDVKLIRTNTLRTLRIRLNGRADYIFNLFRIALIVLMLSGFLYTVYAFTISPIIINLVLVAIYLFLFVANIVIYLRINGGSLGRVVDSQSRQGLDWTSVRLFGEDKTYIALTNKAGLFRLNVKPGKYRKVVYREGYEPARAEMEIGKEGFVNKDFELKRISGNIESNPFAG